MTPTNTYYKRLAETIIKNLERRQMQAHYCPTAAEAVTLVTELIPGGSLVSFGGSMTLKESGMTEALNQRQDITLLDRSKAGSPQEVSDIYHKALSADYFLMSSNAICTSGELVNIDGTGNRLAPINAIRLERNTPCAVTGACSDCQSPDCICAQTVITRRSMTPGRIKVILIGQELGY